MMSTMCSLYREEVGCRGAVVSAERIKPDMGISVDVDSDHFYPTDLEGANAVGEGVGISVGNPSAMLDEYLVDEMIACCEEKTKSKYQRDVMDRGGTDASSINMSGGRKGSRNFHRRPVSTQPEFHHL